MTKPSNSPVHELDTDKNLSALHSSKENWQLTMYEEKGAAEERRPTILVIPELVGNMPSPCSYIRLLGPLSSHRVQEHFQIRVAKLEYASMISADAIILNRVPCAHVSDLDQLLRYVRENNTKLVYEIDDNLLNLSSDHPEKAIYQEKEAIVCKLITEADVVWTSTDPLAENIRPIAKRVHVHENFINPSLMEGETTLRPKSSKFSILYMGTKTHSADLSLVMGALRKIHSEGIPFELTLIGVSEIIPNENWIKRINPPVTNYPLFMQWLRSLPHFDLGLAPLEETAFNECKSAIKYWDYTSLSVPTLASDLAAYKKIIVDGETGYLASNHTDDWYKKIRLAICNPVQLTNIVLQARLALMRLHAEINGEESRKNALIELITQKTVIKATHA